MIEVRRGLVHANTSPFRGTGSAPSTSAPTRCSGCWDWSRSRSVPGRRITVRSRWRSTGSGPRPPVAAGRTAAPRGRPAEPVAPGGSPAVTTWTTGAAPPRRSRPADAETVLARLGPRWIGFAPATLSGVVTAAVLIGFGWRIAQEARLAPPSSARSRGAALCAARRCGWTCSRRLAVLMVVTLLSVAGLCCRSGATPLPGTRAARCGQPRAAHHPSTSIEERRLRGWIAPTAAAPAVGGARLQAIATGLRHRGSERGGALLVPPAPLAPSSRSRPTCGLRRDRPGHP